MWNITARWGLAIALVAACVTSARADGLYSVRDDGPYEFGSNAVTLNLEDQGLLGITDAGQIYSWQTQVNDPAAGPLGDGLGRAVSTPIYSPDRLWGVGLAFASPTGQSDWVSYYEKPYDASPHQVFVPGAGHANSLFAAVNDSGVAVGRMQGDAPGTSQAAVFTNQGSVWGVVPLGSLGGTLATALGISNSGTIVGTAGLAGGAPYDFTDFHGFIVEGGKLVDLNELVPKSLGLTIISATGVNDLGQIVAIGRSLTDPNSYRELLLTPSDDPTVTGPPTPGDPVVAPEPTSIVGFGVIALAARFRASRRRKSA